ncbi:hypothetical protein FRAHR75_60103 [Frankia sp. Hr75.2]|nr:hypothetical protein FRAHR75_60103 [Frankia sp. Hr75.2]
MIRCLQKCDSADILNPANSTTVKPLAIRKCTFPPAGYTYRSPWLRDFMYGVSSTTRQEVLL